MSQNTLRKFEVVTDQNCCALLVGHQFGLLLNGGDVGLLALRNNSIALANVNQMHKLPTVFTCVAGGPGGPGRPMGPLLSG